MKVSNLDNSIVKIKEIVEAAPATTHINFRREDDVLVDVPLAHAEFTAKNHPNWTVEGGDHSDVDVAKSYSSSEELAVVPPKPSEDESTDVDSAAALKAARKAARN